MVHPLVILSPCLFGSAPLWRGSAAKGPSQKPPEPLQPVTKARRRRSIFSFLCEISMTKLYVGNLPFTATEEAVRNLFAPHGAVEKLSLITDRDTGKPRGFGF